MASNEVVCRGISLICDHLIKELTKKKQRKRRRWWVRPWIARRNFIGASNALLRELADEDPESYYNHLRMDKSKFEELLVLIAPLITKQNTLMRDTIPNRTKLQIILRYLASGDSFGTLEYLYRVPRNTISYFFQEVCEAIWTALEKFIKVSYIFNEKDNQFT